MSTSTHDLKPMKPDEEISVGTQLGNKQRHNMPRSPGRPKGSPNKTTAAVKDMVREALEKAGGVEYLAKQAKDNPNAFMTLVGKLVPLTASVGVGTLEEMITASLESK